MEQRKYGPGAWPRIHRFGSRWRVGGFSAMNGIFGEYVNAGELANTVKEIMKAFIFIAQI
jgi:hypothetical protein